MNHLVFYDTSVHSTIYVGAGGSMIEISQHPAGHRNHILKHRV